MASVGVYKGGCRHSAIGTRLRQYQQQQSAVSIQQSAKAMAKHKEPGCSGLSSCRLITNVRLRFRQPGQSGERRRPTPTVRTQIPCYFAASGWRQAGKILLSVRLGSGYVGNSLDSLRRSLPSGANLLFLGRICRILASRKENSLLNSLKQGIWAHWEIG